MAEPTLDFTLPTRLPETLPVVPLRRGVLLPGNVGSFVVGRPRSLSAVDAAEGGLVLVAAQREPTQDPAPSDLLSTATLARVVERRRADRRNEQVVLQGLGRVALTGFSSTQPHLEARFQRLTEVWPATPAADGMAQALRAEVKGSAELLGGGGRVESILRLGNLLLGDAVVGSLGAEEDALKAALLTSDPLPRTERALELLVRVRETRKAAETIQSKVQSSTRDQQREFFLRQQLKAIQEELGEGGASDDLDRLRERLAAADLPDPVRQVVDRELKRLERVNPQSPERTVGLDWLEWVADLPWGVQSAVDLDLAALEAALDASHYGLGEVKRQVVEHLAVRKLSGSGRADILLLLGPPGVGKTSIGQAIADATGRKLVRVALGGLRDEAELRGHRRTYIGARPGRLVEGFRRAGTADPVVLLDEVDKLGQGAWGDPASALLEILDPEQNHSFVDRYLEVPFDLSKALFVATANDLSSLPPALRDRLQVLEISGYTRDEKRTIARTYLLERAATHAGVSRTAVELDDPALDELIAGWTREAGVRELTRLLGKLYRAAAVRIARGEQDPVLNVKAENLPGLLGKRRFFEEPPEPVAQPGLATGLAWTPVGGDVLYVESSLFPGNGQLILTGQLGDVMKESARAALTYVLAHGRELGIPTNLLEQHNVHVHVPAGAVPKDGPSAGVTLFTSLASLLSGRAVRPDTAMTGEATLRGRVLPVGGIRSKILAAHRHGIKRVLLPRRNAADLAEVPASALAELEVILVDHMAEVLEAALEPAQATTRAVA